MRVSYEWLRTMVDVPADPSELVAELIRTGTEVEAVERVGADLACVVTGHIVSCVPHPDSDHMHVTMVDVGDRNVDDQGNPVPLQIVCGAPNVADDQHVAVAMIGAELPGGVRIKRSKLRGVESWGMNCSAKELGLGDDHTGIMVLPDDAPVGVDVADYLGIADTVIDCEITPNRPDCLSMEGFATEVSAILDEDTHIEVPTVHDPQRPAADSLVSVSIADPDICQRYVARVVRGVKIGPSPDWLAARVMAAGARPINNVVDVTNYVMYLTGQPLHAFDMGKLTERDAMRHIVVRRAHDGETIRTLDGQERRLTSDMALITDDGETPIGLAGVMGGENSEIDDTTSDVLLESAAFNAGMISRTSRNLDLMSEASIRFERKVDAARCADVADIAAALFEACCGAEVCRGAVDVYPDPQEPCRITLRPARVRELCGADIPDDFMVDRLGRLGCAVIPDRMGAAFEVVVPTSRPDLTREADLVEEVLRLWGMDRVQPTIPAARNHTGGLTEAQAKAKRIGASLRASGLCETLTYDFAVDGDLGRLAMTEAGRGEAVRLLNPLVADQGEMRRSIIPGLLRSVAHNLDHGVERVTLYEQGRVFFGREDAAQPEEPTMVAGVLSGTWGPAAWNEPVHELDFYDAKGIVEAMLAELDVERVRLKPANPEHYPWLQPGRGALVMAGKRNLGWIGDIHPRSLAAFGIDRPVIAFELDQGRIIDVSRDQRAFHEVPALPGVEVDLAIVVDEDVTYETCLQRIQSAGGRLLSEVHLFDIYRDPVRVGLGRKSMAFSLTFRAPDRTLTSEEVDRTMEKLVNKISRSLGAEVRA